MSETGWLQCEQSYSGDNAIFDSFERIYISAGGPWEAALFSRHDFKTITYLITPAAAQWASMLPGNWEPATDPHARLWTFLIGDTRAPDAFGIKLGLGH